ncbi:MAG: hypothetical protein JWO38_8041 [Gemmataceae bacterium]|nr:hypothetical protein [Gemmataceae bacterium]
MSMRSGLLGLAGVLAVTGATAAKPPDLPAEPLVEGREPTPVVREYYEADVPRPAVGVVPTLPPRSGSPRPVADFLSGFRDTMLNRLTIPLGPAPVRE